jgi:hypothetical protein
MHVMTTDLLLFLVFELSYWFLWDDGRDMTVCRELSVGYMTGYRDLSVRIPISVFHKKSS